MTTTQQEPIRFHRLSDEYGAFTNFSRHPVIINATVWATCEHYVQAAKFPGSPHAARIRDAATPSRARALARTQTVPARPDWREVSIEIMTTALRAKFVQHPRLAHQLLLTGTRPLIETTRSDYFWGAGADGTGHNTTGQILTQIRAELAATTPAWQPTGTPPSRWVAFGAATIVRPTPTPSRDDTVAALRLLRSAAHNHRRLSITREHDVRIEIAGEGEVLLRTPGWNADGIDVHTDLEQALTRAATQPITWVHDPRWPRGRS